MVLDFGWGEKRLAAVTRNVLWVCFWGQFCDMAQIFIFIFKLRF
jgi:hypothetical protein